MRGLLWILCLTYSVLSAQTFNFPVGGINNNTTLCVNVNVSALASPSPSFGLESVTLNILHSKVEELKITLENPEGQIVTLVRYNEVNGTNFTNTKLQKGGGMVGVLSSGSAPYTNTFRVSPDSLGLLNIATSLNGNWKLCIKDTAFLGNNVSGFLNGASITFGSNPAFPPPCKADFSATTLTGCAPLTVKFTDASLYATTVSYDFGDLSTSTQRNPSHIYTAPGTYTVTQTLTQNGFSTDTKVRTNYIVVDVPTPIASFNVDTLGCAPYTANFTNTTTNGSTYQWDFGNSTTSVVANPTPVVYTSAGTYFIKLIAFNAVGCSDTIKKKIVVLDTPKAKYTGLKKGCVPFVFTPNNQSQQALTYTWNFGDGSPLVSGVNPTHTYTQIGVFVVKLIAQNGSCTDTLTDTVRVYQIPTVDFSANPTYIDISAGGTASVDFTNLSTPQVRTLWNFGDGNTSTAVNPTHIYTTGGRFTVSLTITDTTSACVVQTVKKEYLFVDMRENIFVPTAFTPNNDGVNDVFEVKASGVEEITVQVYNRWGELVFENIGNIKFWEANNAPQGVYGYVVRGKGILTRKVLEKSGTVTVLP